MNPTAGVSQNRKAGRGFSVGLISLLKKKTHSKGLISTGAFLTGPGGGILPAAGL